MIRYQVSDQIRWATISLDVKDSHQCKSLVSNGNEFLRWDLMRILANTYDSEGRLIDPRKINAIELDYALKRSGYQVDLLEGEELLLCDATEHFS